MSDSIVIIPTYNEKENIEKIIRAVFGLEKQFDILVIDDGSPDGTAAIVKGFLNTYIVNVYPDTTCWVNDFRNAENETYLRSYFSNPAYNDYPVVGVTWEQANAFCAWRTDYLLKGLGPEASLGNKVFTPSR